MYGVMRLKKAGRIVLIIIAAAVVLVIVAAAGVMLFKPDLAKAVYHGLASSSEDIEKKLEQNEKELINTINDFGFTLTEEDVKLLNEGSLTEEQMTKLLLGDTSVLDELGNGENSAEAGGASGSQSQNGEGSSDGEVSNSASSGGMSSGAAKPSAGQSDSGGVLKPSKPASSGSTSAKPSGTNTGSGTQLTAEQKREYDEKIASLVAKMYALKAQYTGKVEGVVSSMKAEYAALPKEQRTASAKSSIASSYLGTISSLEAQCDAQVNAVVSELREVLEKSGSDTSLADSILTAYANEKENTKAYYINKYS